MNKSENDLLNTLIDAAKGGDRGTITDLFIVGFLYNTGILRDLEMLAEDELVLFGETPLDDWRILDGKNYLTLKNG